jgi:hypothetical protein
MGVASTLLWPILLLLLLVTARCHDSDNDNDGNIRAGGGGETPPSVAGRAADPAGALLAEYQYGAWSAGGGGIAHAHRALTAPEVIATEVGKVIASDGATGAHFGTSIATNGSITVVGARTDSVDLGRQTPTISPYTINIII